MFKVFVVLCSISIATVFAKCDINAQNDLKFRLSGIAMEFPCASTKNIYTTSGRFIPKNIMMNRMQIYRDEGIIAIPRLKSGVPYTLGKVSLKKGDCSPVISPFPCWSLQEEGNCQAMQSVLDIFMDGRDILWVLDGGIVNSLETPVRRCSPKVLGIDIRTGRVLKSINLSNLMVARSRLQYLVVDNCDSGNTYIYVADAGSHAILVYDVNNDKSYRVILPGAVCSENAADVLYMVLVRKTSGKYLYFTYLKSSRIYSIKVENLRSGQGSGAVVEVGFKPHGLPIVLLGTDQKSGIFWRYKGQGDIFLWDAETSFKTSNFIEVMTGDDCRLATQVLPGYKRHMWALESNFNDFISGKVGCGGASIILRPVIKDCDPSD